MRSTFVGPHSTAPPLRRQRPCQAASSSLKGREPSDWRRLRQLQPASGTARRCLAQKEGIQLAWQDRAQKEGIQLAWRFKAARRVPGRKARPRAAESGPGQRNRPRAGEAGLGLALRVLGMPRIDTTIEGMSGACERCQAHRASQARMRGSAGHIGPVQGNRWFKHCGRCPSLGSFPETP